MEENNYLCTANEKEMANIDIKKNLKRLGWSITDLAKALGIAQPSLSSQIGGNPTLANLQKMADVVGCSVADLVAEENDTSSGINISINSQEVKVSINGQERTYQLKQ